MSDLLTYLSQQRTVCRFSPADFVPDADLTKQEWEIAARIIFDTSYEPGEKFPEARIEVASLWSHGQFLNHCLVLSLLEKIRSCLECLLSQMLRRCSAAHTGSFRTRRNTGIEIACGTSAGKASGQQMCRILSDPADVDLPED